MASQRLRMVVKLHHIHLNLFVALQEFLLEPARRSREFCYEQLMLGVSRHLHLVRSM